MDEQERDRRLAALAMDSLDLGVAYTALGNAWRLLGPRLGSSRPDSVEKAFGRLRELAASADDEAERIERETFEANVGQTNDGPDRWGSL